MLARCLAVLPLLVQDPDPVAAARRDLAAAEAEHGADSVEASDAATRLGNLLASRDDSAGALVAFERALAIRAALFGDSHVKTRVALSNVANVQIALCAGDRAAALLERALASYGADEGEDQVQVTLLFTLGAAKRQLGRHRESRAAMERAEAVADRVCPGQAHAALAKVGLASELLAYGEVDRARELMEQALAIAERDPRSRWCAHAAYAVGLALGSAGRHGEAVPVLRRGLELVRVAFGRESTKALQSSAVVAAFLCEAGETAEAAELAAEVVRAAGERVGLHARARSIAHSVLSQAAVARGDARGAVEHAERAAAIPGEGWITANDRARQATVLGTALAAAGDHAAAVAAFRSAVACYEQDAAANGIGDGVGQVDVRTRLSASLAALGDAAGSIAERLRALAAFRANVEMMLPAMLERHRLRAVQGARSNLDALLAVAGVRDDLLSGTQQHAEVLAWKGQVARGIERSLAAARANPDTAAALFRLQQLVRESRDPDDRGALRERQALSAKVAASLPARTDRDDAARIASQLEPGEALVDYLLVRGADGGRRFVAFVARPDRPTVRVDLAPHDATCRAVAAHAQLTSRRTRPGLGASTLAADAARAVQDLVWKPLMPALEGADRVVISPDDVLAELPFETLPGAGSGRFLVEDIAIAYLQSGLGLLRAPPSPGPTRVVAIGDVDYGEAAPAGSERGTPVPFAPLPGTRVELADLRGVYGEERVTVLRGADATEPQVAASVAGATHVHLASHGFCTTSEDAGFDVGIALAFANRARRDGARSTDGILTPDEAALLDLRACRVVVLSACQSGLGMPLSGEHLLGLRRALHIAGARTTVTSLWRVDDAATGALMADFHRALWRDELPPALAWRKVQLARIAAQRAAGEVLPGIWGAFVVEGRP